MRAICTKDILLSGVNTVFRAVSSKNTLPVLQGILLQAESQTLHFAATDLEIGITCQLPAQVDEAGAIVLPARLFAEIVRKLPDVGLDLEVRDGSLTIRYYNSTLVLRGFDPEEFPLLPDLMNTTSVQLPAKLLQAMIRRTVFACGADENRPVFTGVLWEFEGQIIRLVATDTHRLAYSTAEFSNLDDLRFSGIIPAKTVNEINRLLRDEDEIISIQFNNSQAAFRFGTVRLISRLIEGQFPNYKLVIPQSCETKLRVSVREFLEAVERASLLSRDSNLGANIVRLRAAESLLWLEQNSEFGKISERIPIEMEGKQVGITFNSKYLLDVLRVIDSDELIFELSGPNGPGVVRPLTDPNYLCLVLPVRTTS